MMPEIAKPQLASAAAAPARPVLAREADSTYWMARYVERTENVARLLLALLECLTDVRDVAPALLERQWRSVLRIMHAELPTLATTPVPPLSDRIASHMTFAEDNPNSLISCLTRARENARGIRESISTDMWEHLNALYWAIRAEDAPARFQESPHDIYKNVIAGAMSFHGLTDQTLPHDQRWHFAQAGRQLERITFTCSVLQEMSNLLSAKPAESPLHNIRLATILRACNSHEANRRANPGELNASAIATFLLLDVHFPRSVRHCVMLAKTSVVAISAEVRPHITEMTERILGRLQAQMEFTDPAELLISGLSKQLDSIIEQSAAAALAIQNAYFLH